MACLFCCCCSHTHSLEYEYMESVWMDFILLLLLANHRMLHMWYTIQFECWIIFHDVFMERWCKSEDLFDCVVYIYNSLNTCDAKIVISPVCVFIFLLHFLHSQVQYILFPSFSRIICFRITFFFCSLNGNDSCFTCLRIQQPQIA